MKYELGSTFLISSDFGYRGGRVRCPDGKLRVLKRCSAQPDTFFSIPAAIDAYGKGVSGFVSLGERIDVHGCVVYEYIFTPYEYGVNGEIFNDRKGNATNTATSL